MKKITRVVLCFGLLFFLSKGKIAEAWTFPGFDLKEPIEKIETPSLIVTTTPTSILIKPIKDIEMEVFPLATKTPTPIIVTQVVTATPEPTVSITEVKPTITEMTTQEPTVAGTEETLGEEVEMTEDKTDSNNWFWVVIIGLLALILVAQVWSTRQNKSDKDKQDDIK